MQSTHLKSDALERIAGFWSAAAEGYNERPADVLDIERAAWIRILRDLAPAPRRDVLDVGTGPGDLAWLFAALGHRVTGIDHAAGMLAVARTIPPPPPARPPVYLYGDVQMPPFPPATFDIVASRFLLWTLLDPAATLAAWLTLLRPGGVMLAFDCLWWLQEMRDPRTGALRFDHGPMVARYSQMAGVPLPVPSLERLADIEALAVAAGFESVSARRLDDLERALWPVMDARGEGRYPIHVLSARKPE